MTRSCSGLSGKTVAQPRVRASWSENSGRFPLCGRGDVNTYSLFAELDLQLNATSGRVGIIIPSGIASDDTTKVFFQYLTRTRALVSLHSFENEEFLFPAVHHSTKFCLITLTGSQQPQDSSDFVFFTRRTEQLQESDRHFTLSAEEIRLMNPNTGTCPIFRSKRDAEINKAIYRRVPVLVREGKPEQNPWDMMTDGVSSDMGDADTIDLCSETEIAGASALRVYEAKLIHQFDHRLSTYQEREAVELGPEQKQNPDVLVKPRFWINQEENQLGLPDTWERDWLLVWRDICRNTDQRTAISCIIPKSGTDFTLRVGFPRCIEPNLIARLVANLNAFVFDYCVRQKLGGTHLSDYIVKQVPIIPPHRYVEAMAESPSPAL